MASAAAAAARAACPGSRAACQPARPPPKIKSSAQRARVVEKFTGHYVFMLGLSRFISCAHWILQARAGPGASSRALPTLRYLPARRPRAALPGLSAPTPSPPPHPSQSHTTPTHNKYRSWTATNTCGRRWAAGCGRSWCCLVRWCRRSSWPTSASSMSRCALARARISEWWFCCRCCRKTWMFPSLPLRFSCRCAAAVQLCGCRLHRCPRVNHAASAHAAVCAHPSRTGIHRGHRRHSPARGNRLSGAASWLAAEAGRLTLFTE